MVITSRPLSQNTGFHGPSDLVCATSQNTRFSHAPHLHYAYQTRPTVQKDAMATNNDDQWRGWEYNVGLTLHHPLAGFRGFKGCASVNCSVLVLSYMFGLLTTQMAVGGLG